MMGDHSLQGVIHSSDTDTLLVGEKHAYRQQRFVPAPTSQSEPSRKLGRPENKQIVGAVAMHALFDWHCLE